MEFEFDSRKSISIKEKHGIDFEEAQSLWGDPNRVIVPVRSQNEERYALIAASRTGLWTYIFTVRGEKLRIISVRKARNEEKEGYYHG